MNCDYLVFLILGFAENDPNRGIGRNVSDILKKAAEVCKTPPLKKIWSLPYESSNVVDLYDSGYDKRFDLFGQENQLKEKLNRGNELRMKPFRQMSDEDIMKVNDDVLGRMTVKVPASVISSLISRDQLSTLYQNNEAFDVPGDDPSAPRMIAITKKLLNALIKGKKRLHNAIDNGVIGAENIFSGLHKSAGGIADIIGGGAHSILDLFP